MKNWKTGKPQIDNLVDSRGLRFIALQRGSNVVET